MNWKDFFIGLGTGLAIALVVYVWQLIKRVSQTKKSKKEIANLRTMLNDRMDLEAEGIARLKAQNQELKDQIDNLKITNANLMQKTDKAELQRLNIYQKAVDRLIINSPGFGAAWQSALQESEEEFSRIYSGTQAFWKKIIPGKTDAKLIDENSDEE